MLNPYYVNVNSQRVLPAEHLILFACAKGTRSPSAVTRFNLSDRWPALFSGAYAYAFGKIQDEDLTITYVVGPCA